MAESMLFKSFKFKFKFTNHNDKEDANVPKILLSRVFVNGKQNPATTMESVSFAPSFVLQKFIHNSCFCCCCVCLSVCVLCVCSLFLVCALVSLARTKESWRDEKYRRRDSLFQTGKRGQTHATICLTPTKTNRTKKNIL